jgi:hypothetical protein
MSEAQQNGRRTEIEPEEIEEGDTVRFEEMLLGYDIVDEGEVVETPPWSLKVGDSVLSYTDSVHVQIPSVGRLPVSFEHILEVVSE